jgi:serine/threonine protein kinase
VHGDFKPGNILIHEDIDKTSQGIKIIDFGFSAYNSNNEDFLRIARTEPWEAPEWHNRGFTLRDAKSMDIYSFGLVCMWLFFREEKLADLGFPFITLGEAFSRQKPDATSRIQVLKGSGDDLLTYALRLLERRSDLEHGLRARLRQGLTLALASSPKERSASMEPFIELFCDPEYVV